MSGLRRWGGLAVAIVLAVGVFGWVAARKPLHFDGAMNLQVARFLAEDGDYARQYDYERVKDPASSPPWIRAHPYEVQTNGPFVFTAAVGLLVLGDGPLGLQSASLAFVALAAAAIWGLLRRRWPVAAALIPALLLLLLADPFGNVIGGLGEIPGLALLLVAVLLVVESLHAPVGRRSVLLLCGASVAAGLAMVTKTYFGAAVGALAVGWLAVWWLRRPPGWVLAVQPLALATPLVAFEAYKLANLGGLAAYREWWDEQAGGISAQSGVGEGSSSGLGRVADQAHRLADATGLPAEVVALLVVAAVAAAGVSVVDLWRRGRSSRGLLVELSVAQVMTATLAVTYLAWWLVFMPEQWAIARRTYPIMLPLGLSLVLAVAGAGLRWERVGRWAPVAGVATLLVVILLAGSVSTVADGLTTDRRLLEANQAMAERIRADPPGRQHYGIGFWSAPIVSLMADRPLRNLEEADPCALPDDAVLVLDRSGWAALGTDPPTLDGAYRYTPIVAEPAARLFRIEPTGLGCD